MHNSTINISRLLQIKSLILFVILTFSSTFLSAGEPQPWIKSSFDGISIDRSSPNTYYPKIVGTDNVTGYKWMPADGQDKYDTDLPGAYQSGIGFLISNSNMADGDWVNYQQADIKSTTGPDGKDVNALYYKNISDDPDQTSSSRCQFHLKGAGSINPSGNYTDKEWLREFYFTYYVKINKTEGPDWWLMFEQKGHNSNLAGGMGRWQIGLAGFGGDTRWYMYVLEGQRDTIELAPGSKKKDYDAPFPDGQWVKLEVYTRNSWNDDGFVRIAFNGVESKALRYSGPTLYKDYAPSSVAIFKSYGGRGESWFTDFEMWDKPPVTSVLSSNYDGTPVDATLTPTPTPEPTPEPTPKGGFIITPGVLKPQ